MITINANYVQRRESTLLISFSLSFNIVITKTAIIIVVFVC